MQLLKMRKAESCFQIYIGSMGSLHFIFSRDAVQGNTGKLIINECKPSLFNYIIYFQVPMFVIIIKNRYVNKNDKNN